MYFGLHKTRTSILDGSLGAIYDKKADEFDNCTYICRKQIIEEKLTDVLRPESDTLRNEPASPSCRQFKCEDCIRRKPYVMGESQFHKKNYSIHIY